MKKLTTLLLAAGMVFAASAPASAVDIKMDGLYTFQYTWGSNPSSFAKDSGSFDRARQLVRIGMTASVSENLSAYFQTNSEWDWGRNDDESKNFDGSNPNWRGGSGFDGTGVDVTLYRAYVDWVIPSTAVKVRMGRQDLALPALADGKNTAIWSKDPVDGISINAPVTDWLALTAWWGRFDRRENDHDAAYYAYDTDQTSKLDVFALIADMTFDGFRFTPFAAYASYGDGTYNIDANNNDSTLDLSANAFWVGATGEMSLYDPFNAKLSFVYGDKDFTDGTETPSQHGWFAEGSVSYKTAYGTPELLAFYGSGDSDSAPYRYAGNMPSQGGRFKGSYAFFNGSAGLQDNDSYNNKNGQGLWGVRLGMTGISFLEDLTHNIAVVYAMGTNDADAGWATKDPHRYMTTDDSMVEFDFSTTYQIYKNLSAYFEAAYIIENFETHDNDKFASRASSYDDGWKLAMQLQYKF